MWGIGCLCCCSCTGFRGVGWFGSCREWVFGDVGAVGKDWDFSGRSGGGSIFRDIRGGRVKGDRMLVGFLGSVRGV